MKNLCIECNGFVPNDTSCPNCATGQAPTLPRWLKSAGIIVGSGALGMTLATCYGAPCIPGADGKCVAESWQEDVCADPNTEHDAYGRCIDSNATDVTLPANSNAIAPSTDT